MKFHNVFNFAMALVLLGGVAAYGAGDAAITNWEGAFTREDGNGRAGGVTIKVVDSKIPDDGVYAISKAFPVDPACSYELSGWCKTNGKVTSGSVIYLRFDDAAGKSLESFATARINSTNWTGLYCSIPAGKIPDGAVNVRILLQAAAGAAGETGTAWFDDIRFYPVKEVALAPGQKDYSREVFAKASSTLPPLALDAPTLVNDGITATLWRPLPQDNKPWLELSWRDALPELVVLVNSGACLLEKIGISFWNDQAQSWQSAGTAAPEVDSSGNYVRIVPKNIPAPRKIRLDFIQYQGKLEIGEVKLLATPDPEENWQASWIWYTRERIEFIHRYFRKKIILGDEVESAFFQGTGDDSAVFYVNGKKIRSGASWRQSKVSEITDLLVKGENVIAADVYNTRYAAGLIAEIDINLKSGESRKIVTDKSWASSPVKPDNWMSAGFDDSAWVPSVLLGVPPDGDWGQIKYVNCAKRKEIILQNQPLPSHAMAGEQLNLDFILKLPTELDRNYPVYLCMSRNNCVFIRQRLDDGKLKSAAKNGAPVKLSALIKLSPFLYPGDYVFSLYVPFCGVKNAGKEWMQTVAIANSRKPAMVTAQVKPIHSIPTLHIDDEPFWSMFYTAISGRAQEINTHRIFAANGVKMVHCYVTPDIPAPGEYGFTETDRIISEILDNNPDVKIILKPGFRDIVPAWFIRQYPNELAVLDGGLRLSKPSLASTEWRKVAGGMLRGLIRHVKNGPYADRVIGYFVCEGEEGQWMHYWGGADLSKDNVFSDYSPAMRAYFSNWLKCKYGDAKSLRRAWGAERIDFAEVAIPGRLERLQSGVGMFRDPLKNRPAIDFAEALSDVICEGIAYYAAIVKEETERKAVMMAFYGHIMDLGANFLGEQVGYLKQRQAILCPDVDYYAGPIAYGQMFRDIGGTAAFDYPAPACLRLQNKIWLNEDDVRTHLTNPPGYAYSVRRPEQMDEVLAREFAKALCAGAGLYWLNLSGGHRNWFDDPQTVATIGTLNRIGQAAVKDDLSSVSRIAMVASDRALLYSRPIASRGKKDAMFAQCVAQREQIGRIGAPFDEYLVDDLLNPSMPDYQLYIFLNPWYLTGAERAAIMSKLRKNHATALWFYAPGVVSDNGLSTAETSELTGIGLTMMPVAAGIRMRMTAGNALLPNYAKEFGMPEGCEQSPLFVPVAGGSYETLAILSGNGKPGLVRNNVNGVVSYYCATPVMPAEILRAIAVAAGIHIYSDSNDAVYACKSYLAIHTGNNAGTRNLVLPENMRIRQVYPPGEERAVDLHNIQFQADTPQTRIYRVAERSNWFSRIFRGGFN